LDLTLLIHPALAISVVLLVTTAYLLKTRRKLYFVAHYVAGILAFVLVMTAFPIGLYYVYIDGGMSVFPPAIIIHTANFVLAIAAMVVQGGLGLGMLLFGRKRGWYSTHRRIAKYVLAIFIAQGTLGLAVLYGIIPYVFGQ
jgi:hypothetical protein